MSQPMGIQEGMRVYGGDQLLGRVESLHGDGFHMNGLHYTPDMVTRVADGAVYLGDSGRGDTAATTVGSMGGNTAATAPLETATAPLAMGGETYATDVDAGLRETDTTGMNAGQADMSGTAYAPADAAMSATARTDELTDRELRVPVAEERLTVGKRDVDLGEVEIRKTITEEEQTVPVTLTHEEIRVEERAVTDRPATGDELFREETINVTLRGQEAVVAKETIVTGEVVVEKDAVAEERQITDTVRRQHVDVDQTTQTVAGAASMPPATAPMADTSATLASTGTTGYGAQLRESMEVFGSDGARIGTIKEVRTDDFLIDRRMARDVYVPFGAIESVTSDGVTITVPAGDVNDQGWPNP